jgi:hypothetical protein
LKGTAFRALGLDVRRLTYIGSTLGLTAPVQYGPRLSVEVANEVAGDAFERKSHSIFVKRHGALSQLRVRPLAGLDRDTTRSFLAFDHAKLCRTKAMQAAGLVILEA